ncbi:MAG: hypothetical protein IJS20_06650 [Bacteroidales bacterium]|nr:hypothetical protein [Bacteroidales bacterium]
MRSIILKGIKPEDFEAIRVISFRDSLDQYSGTIVYRRPLSSIKKDPTKKDPTDDFDRSMLSWLEQLNFQRVQFLRSENILFDNQLQEYQQIYDGGRPQTLLSLTCHGNYTKDELIARGSIKALEIKIPIYWNALKPKLLFPEESGTVTFDKNKEQYFFDTIKAIKTLPRRRQANANLE